MASPITASSARPFTYEDLEAMPDDGYRREIIGGSLIVNPSPTAWHQRAVFAIARRLYDAQPPDLETLIAPFDVRAPGDDVLVPDVLVIRRGDLDATGRLAKSAIPELVVEVLSPSNRRYDQRTKRDLYAEAGVPSYWIMDPEAPSLTALLLHAGAYETAAHVAHEDLFSTEQPFALDLRPADLLR